MAKNIVQFNLDGQTVYVEGEYTAEQGKFIASSGDKSIVEATNSFETAMNPVMAFTRNVMERISKLEVQKPATVEIEFGIKLSGAVNFWVISGTGEGSINLKLSWKTTP